MERHMTDTNDTPSAGHNKPPAEAQHVTDRMAADYAELAINTRSLIDDASLLPAVVQDHDDSASVSAMVVKLRDLHKRTESLRVTEKAPYLRAGEAVDAFFFGLQDLIKPVGKDLNGRVHDFNQRLLQEERRKQAEELRKRQEEEAAARRRQEAADKAAQEAAAAAARARKPETVEARQQEADKAREEAEVARVDTMIAQEQSVQAFHETLKSPSQLVGHRFSTDGIGGQVGMRRQPVVAIEDSALLDKTLLWPFIKEEEKLRALKAWAKTTSHRTKMEGAIITTTDGTVIR
jgi:flagellar biosynthesis GTPase FlhF